jgi:hypothetical protein
MSPVIESIDAMQRRLNHPVGQSLLTKPGKRACFGRRWRLRLVIAASMCVVTSIWADAVYLRTVGPAPLRFRAVVKAITKIVALPPPEPPKPVATLPTNGVDKTAVAAVPAEGPDATAAVEEIDATSESSRASEVVSPQMLLKYFGKSTNGGAAGFSVPFEFIPPPPPELPSSKAEYSTPAH